MAGTGFLKNQLLRVGIEPRRIPKANSKDVYFLHIGKTAGSQIGELSQQINTLQRSTFVVRCPHSVKLRDLPRKAPYFFSIRNPISRFRSGFYSRKRMGQPRYLNPWRKDEESAFYDFPHANDLAEALFRKDELGAKAFLAIQSIGHISSQQVDWFGGEARFLVSRPPVFIVRQEHFERDFAMLMKNLSLPFGLELLSIENDERKSHRYDYAGVPSLSELAVENLRIWYARDIELYRACDAWCD